MTAVYSEIKAGDYQIVFREATETDLPRIGELLFAYVFESNPLGATIEREIERWRGRFETYPQGIVIAEDVSSGRIVGAHAGQIINWKYPEKVSSWPVMTDGGTIRGSHKPDGNTYHVVTNVVHHDYTGLKTGVDIKIGSTELDIALKRNFLGVSQLQYAIVIPAVGRSSPDEYNFFAKFIGDEKKLTLQEKEKKAWEYFKLKKLNPKSEKEETADRVARFYERNGFNIVGPLVGGEGYSEYDICALMAITKE